MKTHQNVINNLAIREWNYAMKYLDGCPDYSFKRLRYCNAIVYITDRYFILKSYNTLVACINRYTGIQVDMLRYEYKFTRTSAQHISKFFNDYSISLSYPAKRYTYKSI